MTIDEIVGRVRQGDDIPVDALAALPDRDRERLVSTLLDDAIGRRWLRTVVELDTPLADRLLAFTDDFRGKRRDRTLGAIIVHASEGALHEHATTVAGGPAAADLWERLRHHPDELDTVAREVVEHGDQQAAEGTLYLLVLDHLDTYAIGPDGRAGIARAALRSPDPHVRGLAAEFLAGNDPKSLMESFDVLIHDENERVRGIIWATGLSRQRRATYDRAVMLIGDESTPTPVRRSALVAIGTTMPTRDLVDLLTYLVVHPDPVLAGDAASLLYNHHRNPITAEAALASPHESVRSIAERLLDPFRGSPAAGGSRPGDPTKVTDIYAGMIRQLEEREAEMKRQANGDGDDEENHS